jgi:oligosaccharyltransferase complex subunit alpha (ribophorin I)
VSLTFECHFTRTLTPLPASIQQGDAQYVVYDGSASFYSPYAADSVETVLRLYSGKVESYTKLHHGKKVGDEVRYGPVPGSTPLDDTRRVQVHYLNNAPFVTFNEVSKDVEVSHWGNVAVQDNYLLEHTGARLTGPFSRFDYERGRGGEQAPAAFRTLVGELPRGARDVYYRDCIGNVSTSHVRRASDHLRLELDPRFPMFGGWTSDFHVGYNLPSQHYLSVDDHDGAHYVLSVPFASPFASAAIDALHVRIILPEGATDIQWRTPFEIDAAEFTEVKTYLDTTGRPTLLLSKRNAVHAHQQAVLVSYRFAQAAILREPLLLTAAVFGVLGLVMAWVHSDLRISADDEHTGRATPSQLRTRREGTALVRSPVPFACCACDDCAMIVCRWLHQHLTPSCSRILKRRSSAT